MARTSLELDKMTGLFVKVGLVVLFLIIASIGACSSCSLVEPGHVGIRVERAGANRGVQDLPIVSGWVMYNPITTTIIEFPTTVQTTIWTQVPHEGQPVDESITFQSSEGMPINADIALSYHIDAAHAGRFYTRFRVTELRQITDGYVRNLVRDAMVERAATHPIHDLYGAGKTTLLNDALTQVRARLGSDGFVIDQLSYQGTLRFPPNIVDSINRTIQANQDAEQARNQIAIREAEARQQVAQAQGRASAQEAEATGAANALLTRTRADAEALRMRSEAEAAANQRIAQSLTPQLIELRRIERWNGAVPQFQGSGSNTLIQFPHQQ